MTDKKKELDLILSNRLLLPNADLKEDPVVMSPEEAYQVDTTPVS